jgi:hypothetical protein
MLRPRHSRDTREGENTTIVVYPVNNVNTRKRKTLDYHSVVGCFTTLVFLLALLLTAYAYVTVPGGVSSSFLLRAGSPLASVVSEEEIIFDECEDIEDIDAAKATLAKKTAEVETAVRNKKVDDHYLKEEEEEKSVVEAARRGDDEEHATKTIVETPPNNELSTTTTMMREGERMKKEEKKIDVEALVEKELGINMWCGTCMWKDYCTCDKRKDWLMDRYKITEVVAKEASKKFCVNKKL